MPEITANGITLHYDEHGDKDAPPEPPAEDKATRLLGLFDRDNDQSLSREEAPPRLKPIFGRVDRDGDGSAMDDVLDVTGRHLRTLAPQAGADRVTAVWDGRDGSGQAVSSGVYFYRLDAGRSGETRKMVLIK